MNALLKTAKQSSPSAWASLMLVAAIVFFRFQYPPVNILSWDVFGYYLYLPATFIYHDLRLADVSWVNHLIGQYQTTSTFYQATALPAGGWVMKYSMGMAVLNAPAFFVAHYISPVLGFSADGFSLPYQYAWAISGLVYAAVGILMLRQILIGFFDEKTTIILLVIIVLATNYFQLTAFEGYLSHNYLFTLYTFIVWFTIRWHENQRGRYAVALGLSMGLAVLTRPSEAVCVVIPILWNVGGLQSLKQKWNLLRNNFKQVFLLAFSVTVAGLPQLLYWKYATGQWLFYSYINPGEGFDFCNPYLKEVLFSFRKGWLVYTPMMIFALAGFVALFKQNKLLFYGILSYFLINLYVVSGWSCWWYAGGSYSQRALLSSYVVLAIPLGYFFIQILTWKPWLRNAIYFIAILFLSLNLFQTWQWAHGIIDRTRMTKGYYFAIFGKTAATESDRKLLLIERSNDNAEALKNESDYIKRTAAFFDFEQAENNGLPFTSDTVFGSEFALRMDENHPYSLGFEMPFDEITQKDHAWLRAEVMVFPVKPIEENMASLVITFQHKGENYHYRAASIALEEFRMKPGQWNLMKMDYLTPEVRSKRDAVKVYFWLQGKSPVLIDNMKVEIFEPLY